MSDNISAFPPVDSISLEIAYEVESLLARSLAVAVGEDYDKSVSSVKSQLQKDAMCIMGAAAVSGLMIIPRRRMAELVERYVRMELERAKNTQARQANGDMRVVRDARESIEPSPPIPSDPRIRSFIGRSRTVHKADGEIWDSLASRYRDQKEIDRVDPDGDETSQRTYCLGNDGRPVECTPQ